MSHQGSFEQASRQGRLKKRLAIFAGGVVVVATALAARYLPGDKTAEAAAPSNVSNARVAPTPAPRAAATPRPGKSPHDVVAVVNGQQIHRGLLAQECVKHYGKKVLESLLNKYIIAIACHEANFSIPEQEVAQEIDRVARRFGIPVDQWLTMLERERGITAEQYASEIIWPTLALKRLAAADLQVADDDIRRALERQYGPQVHVRLILVSKREDADRIHQQATAKPESFPKLAREYSSDVSSASAGGLIQPIRLHSGDPKIEAAAFALKEDEVSTILPVGDQFAILKCETHIAAKQPGAAEIEQARKVLEDNLRDGQLREASAKLFQELQDNAEIENVFNDPVKRQQMPGVAATINGHQITMVELADACVLRHGSEIIEGQINRALLTAALAEKNLSVTQQHINEEVERAARTAGVVSHSGGVLIEKWIEMVTKQQDITEQIYINDIVWPSVALKLLVADTVEVTDVEMQKAFEAHYGPRVRCRAIVMSNQRRATEVWEMLRFDNSVTQFSKLAEQYSVDPSGKALGGEIPPIQRHGGQPALEKEAFSLQPGEISGIVTLSATKEEQHYAILFCEGYTKPVVDSIADVEEELHKDLLEKKFRIIMAGHFQKLRESANIENLLYPSASSTPQKQTASLPAGEGRFAPRTNATR